MKIQYVLPICIVLLACCKEDNISEPGGNDPQTLDTTDHFVKWTVHVLGAEGSGSVFKSVSAISAESAYAVGRLRKYDTTGNGSPILFNSAHWNGNTWLEDDIPNKRVLPDGDSVVAGGSGLESVWGEAPNNWTFATGGPLVYYDGTTFVTDLFFRGSQQPASASFLWGDEKDRWIGSVTGHLSHGTGRSYTVHERLTTASITGICGNENEVWAVTGYFDRQYDVLRYKNARWQRMNDSLSCDDLRCTNDVWCSEVDSEGNYTLVMVGSEIMVRNEEWTLPTVPNSFIPSPYYFLCVDGAKPNDIFVAGDHGKVVHYNGSTWHYYEELTDNTVYIYDICAKDDIVICVGRKGSQAVIYTGLRN